MKFTDEELSRILTCHANNDLRQGFTYEGSQCCMMQAAKCARVKIATANQWPFVEWFDANYNPGWPLGKFLRELERQGLA